MTTDPVAILRQRFTAEPYPRTLGIELVSLERGRAVVQMSCTEKMNNIFGTTHGGAIFSLIDEAFQLACNSHGTVAVALNLNVTYHRPAAPGVNLRAVATEIHRGRRTATYDVTVSDRHGNLIARCQALAYRKSEALPGVEAGTRD